MLPSSSAASSAFSPAASEHANPSPFGTAASTSTSAASPPPPPPTATTVWHLIWTAAPLQEATAVSRYRACWSQPPAPPPSVAAAPSMYVLSCAMQLSAPATGVLVAVVVAVLVAVVVMVVVGVVRSHEVKVPSAYMSIALFSVATVLSQLPAASKKPPGLHPMSSSGTGPGHAASTSTHRSACRSALQRAGLTRNAAATPTSWQPNASWPTGSSSSAAGVQAAATAWSLAAWRSHSGSVVAATNACLPNSKQTSLSPAPVPGGGAAVDEETFAAEVSVARASVVAAQRGSSSIFGWAGRVCPAAPSPLNFSVRFETCQNSIIIQSGPFPGPNFESTFTIVSRSSRPWQGRWTGIRIQPSPCFGFSCARGHRYGWVCQPRPVFL